MKRLPLISLIILLLPAVANAQFIEDAVKFSETFQTGTARSMAMGNAFGALGGDFSSLSINPAGIAVYRSSEFTFTPSLIFNQTDANYYSHNSSDEKYSFPFNQVGMVGTYKPIREGDKGIISTHFGLGYNRMNTYNKNAMIVGEHVPNSLLDEFVINSNGHNTDHLGNFGPGLAYDTYLTGTLPGIDDHYFHAYEYIDNNNNIISRANQGIHQRKVLENSGYKGEYSFTFGANFSHILMLGGSINIQNIYFKESSLYRETNAYGLAPAEGIDSKEDIDYYDYYSHLKQTGTGVNFKLGLIFKPISALRIGAAYHTPTFYSIKEDFHNDMYSYFKDGFTAKSLSLAAENEYKFQTPYKLIGSVGLVLGKSLIVSADYEYSDYTSSKFKSREMYDENIALENQIIDERLKATHNIRGGVEFKLTPQFALRGGFGYYDTPYKEEYEYEKSSFFTYSGGFGFRDKSYFIDVAYMMIDKETNHFLYNWEPSEDIIYGEPKPARLNSIDHQVAVTLGWKF
ncbi:hydrocarbon degradation protein [Marinilabiliaceae bacterium JC017]|nr:hydrocarbon degradation protein [Marinilabiliaceae bacterium JC017]